MMEGTARAGNKGLTMKPYARNDQHPSQGHGSSMPMKAMSRMSKVWWERMGYAIE
jgi:hypothetical protein